MDSTVLKRGRPLPDPTPIDLRFHVPLRTSGAMDERRPAKGSLQNVSLDLPPFRLETVRFQAWWLVRFSEPPDDPLGTRDWLSARRSIVTGVPWKDLSGMNQEDLSVLVVELQVAGFAWRPRR